MESMAVRDWQAELLSQLVHVMPESEAFVHLPVIEEIRALKVAHRAVVVAHNYQVPLITAGIADSVKNEPTLRLVSALRYLNFDYQWT